MGVSQPRISDLVRGRIHQFTIDSLINMLTNAGVPVGGSGERAGGLIREMLARVRDAAVVAGRCRSSLRVCGVVGHRTPVVMWTYPFGSTGESGSRGRVSAHPCRRPGG